MIVTVFAVETAYTFLARNDSAKSQINRRMKLAQQPKTTQHDILVKLRKERGMDARGRGVLPIKALSQLVIQAGITVGLKKFALYHALYTVVATFAVLLATRSLLVPIAAFPIIAFVLPVLWLRHRKNRKMTRFGKQLPEAIELITRSLKAGHPVPVALTMVAREMPDPIGTEFGMVVDEVTYGSDLVTALLSLYERTGHPDLPLLVSAVSIQSTTGGNLREILDSLSRVIRERLKMKAKVKAISAEGRMSAGFLSAMPVLLFIVLLTILPDYYGGIWHEPMTWYMFSGLFVWLVTGNLLILKMVSFKV
ncbi:MAG: type II secretion system F family protein [Nitratireductor sp.]|nr:type II secretion system F family protein [Nitratireductor sp.]